MDMTNLVRRECLNNGYVLCHLGFVSQLMKSKSTLEARETVGSKGPVGSLNGGGGMKAGILKGGRVEISFPRMKEGTAVGLGRMGLGGIGASVGLLVQVWTAGAGMGIVREGVEGGGVIKAGRGVVGAGVWVVETGVEIGESGV